MWRCLRCRNLGLRGDEESIKRMYESSKSAVLLDEVWLEVEKVDWLRDIQSVWRVLVEEFLLLSIVKDSIRERESRKFECLNRKVVQKVFAWGK